MKLRADISQQIRERGLRRPIHLIDSILMHNRESREDTILFPQYEKIDTKYDGQLFKRNRKTLEDLGFRVIPVPTSLDRINSGIHCLINIVK